MKKYLFYPLCFAASLFALDENEPMWEEGPSVMEYTLFLQDALTIKDWWSAIDCAEFIAKEFGETAFATDVPYVIGESYFNLDQLELANKNFSEYLSHTTSPKYFEETILYKFEIAEKFRNGAKKPLFGSHKLPKLVPAGEDAIQIYDDVIAALPHHDIAAKSLIGKAQILASWKDYKPSLETLDLLIRRFPKHDLAAQGFLEKSKIFLSQSQSRSLDPALLDLADMNLKKFRNAFPREERIAQVEKDLADIQESFAAHLLETGQFFEKTKKFPAAILYYSKVQSQYPTTVAAEKAGLKLEKLQPKQEVVEES